MVWRYIEEDRVSADLGLAADEFLMSYYPAKKPAPEPTLRLYTYRSHCALVGRFQNIEAELDLEECDKCDVQFGRRPTGGGAILMGQDQLGVCFVASASFFGSEARPIEIYQRLSVPLIRALENLGIQSKFRPKNDLEVKGKKIAGLGVCFDPFGAMLFHASLIVDLDLPLMLRVLKIPMEKISDKADTCSVAQRITTVSRELNRKARTDEVRKRVKQAFEESFGVQMIASSIDLAEKDRIARLAREKYQSKEWIFQRTPQPEMTGMSLTKTRGGLLRTYIGLKGDVLKSVLITGDFLESSETLNQIEARLKWSALEKNSISRVVHEAFTPNEATGDLLNADEVVNSIWKAALNAKAKSRLTNAGSCYYPIVSTD